MTMLTMDVGAVADVVAATVRSTVGVVDLTSTPYRDIATYMPGRQVTGVRVSDGRTLVQVVVSDVRSIPETAAAIRVAVAAVRPAPVDIVVGDLEFIGDTVAELEGTFA